MGGGVIRYQIGLLHDEVKQLEVRSCPLLEVDRTATSTLRGWLEGWGGERVRGGGRAIRVRLKVKRGTGILAQADIWSTHKPHKDTAHWWREKAEMWDGRRLISRGNLSFMVYLISTLSTRQITLREGQGGRFTAETCLPKLKNP